MSNESKYYSFTIIVPAYRDHKFALSKIKNIMALKYPASRVEVLFVKGGCDKEQLMVIHTQDPLVKVIHTTMVGKVNQLNVGIFRALGDIILVSDIDALLQEDTLVKINGCMHRSEIGCVGTLSVPRPAHLLDRIYWHVSNRIRVMESRIDSASHVVATCYAFKRMVQEGTRKAMFIPEDVVADDVYVPLLMRFNGYKAKIIESLRVIETRNPSTLSELARHKSRKGNAFLRELLRFVYKTPDIRGPFKVFYFARLFFMLLLCGAAYPFINQNSNYRKVR